MTRPHARAGTHYTPPMECTSSGCDYPQSECIGICSLHRVVHVERVNAMPISKEPPFEMHEPTLLDKFRSIFKKEWK